MTVLAVGDGVILGGIGRRLRFRLVGCRAEGGRAYGRCRRVSHILAGHFVEVPV